MSQEKDDAFVPSESGLPPAKRTESTGYLSDPWPYKPNDVGDAVTGMSITSLVGMARRRWKQIVLVALPIVALAALYSHFSPQLYHSEATFLLESSGTDAGSQLELLDRIGRVSRLENEVALLQSRRVLRPTVDRLNLNATLVVGGKDERPEDWLPGFDATPDASAKLYSLAGAGTSGRLLDAESGQELARWAAGDTVRLEGIMFLAPNLPTGTSIELRVDDLAATQSALVDGIAVERLGREADLVKLTCTAGAARLARDICEALTESYLELRNELQTSEAANARIFLSDATQRIEDQLTVAEDSLADYSSRYGAVALGARADEEVRNVAGLAAERDRLSAERAALRQFMAGIEAEGSGTARYRELSSFPTFLENDAIVQMVASLIELDNRRGNLAVLRTEASPDLAAINQRITGIELQLKSMVKAYDRAISSQIESLSETLSTANQRVAGIPTKQVELVRRQRKVEQLETMFGTLEGRLREAKLAEGVGMPNVRLIDRPEVPAQPSSTPLKLTLALGSVLGLAVGFLFAGYREVTDVRLRDRTEIEHASGMRVLGMLPGVRDAGPLLGELGAAGTGVGSRRIGRGDRTAQQDREWGPAIEAFRTLATDLKLSMASRNGGTEPPRSMAVMSSAQGEGKTYVTCNLALVWASMGSRTLLIDADLRLGRVARFFGLPTDAVGLADVLRGDVHPSKAYQEVPAGGGNVLHVLTAGRTTATDTDAFHIPGRIDEAMDHLKSEFDLLLVDTPPLNVVSDSTVLAASAESVLFVVRSGHTRPDGLELALQRLQRTNRNLLGVVMNDVTLPSYYRSYYGPKAQG